MSDDKKPGYSFQASMQIGEGIALTVGGTLPIGATTADMVSETNKVLDALEKQNAKRMKLPAIKGALQDQKDALVRAKKQAEELAFQEQGGKLNSAQKAQLNTCHVQIKGISEQIEKGEMILAMVEKEAA